MTGSRTRVTVGGVALSFLLAIVIGISGVIAPGGGAALAASTTLTIIDGEVQVSRGGGPFQAAADGAVLGAGDVIRTAAGSRAVLTYFEGSTVSIEPSSELAIDVANGNPDGSTVVVMTQNLGRTWHVVTKLIGGGSKYEVRTPSATASVRGTAFEVGVERAASGEITTRVATSEGLVAASAPATPADPQPQLVVVAAGFQTTARSTERRLETPTLTPEPDRTVSITIGNANSLVVDPLGRANGFRDGRLVLQTPGAEVTRLAGTLKITLPGLPDGKLSTVVQRGEGAATIDVPVITTVREKGKPSSLLQDTVRSGETVSGVEVRRGTGDGAADLRAVDADEKKDLRAPKVAAQPRLRTAAAVFRPGLGEPRVLASIAEERRSENAANATGGGTRAGEERAAEGQPGPGFVQPLPFPNPPNPGAQQREESRRQDEAKQTERDAAAAEQLGRAAEQAGDAAQSAQQNAQSGQQRANEEQARAAAAAQVAEAARQRAIQQAAQAANAAQRAAAEEAAKKAEDEKKAAEAARLRAEQEAKQKADEAAKAEQAKKAAAELAKKAHEEAERLRRLQQQQQGSGSGGGTSGGGSGGGGGNTGGNSGNGNAGGGNSGR